MVVYKECISLLWHAQPHRGSGRNTRESPEGRIQLWGLSFGIFLTSNIKIWRTRLRRCQGGLHLSSCVGLVNNNKKARIWSSLSGGNGHASCRTSASQGLKPKHQEFSTSQSWPLRVNTGSKSIKLCKTKSQDSYQYMIWGCWLKSEPVPLWLHVRGRD